MMLLSRWTTIALFACTLGACHGERGAPEVDPATGPSTSAGETSVDVVAIDGTRHRLLRPSDDRVTVLLFLLTDCPIANAYAPEIASIRRDFGANVRFVLVHVDRELTDAGAAKHAADYALEGPIVVDRDHRLVRAAGATMTPEAAVFRAGALLYRGRIDNWYAALGKKRARATKHDLRDALRAITAGESVATPRTQPVGCFIPDVP